MLAAGDGRLRDELGADGARERGDLVELRLVGRMERFVEGAGYRVSRERVLGRERVCRTAGFVTRIGAGAASCVTEEVRVRHELSFPSE